MKNTHVICLCLLLMFPLIMIGQSNVRLMQTSHSSVACVVGETEGSYVIKDFEVAPAMGKSNVLIKDIMSADGNVTLVLGLHELMPGEYYELDLRVSIESRTFSIRPESLSRHVVRWNEQRSEYEITWYNAYEEFPIFDRFDLAVFVGFYGRGCPFDIEPKLPFKKQLLYFVPAVTGAALVGIAEFILIPGAEKEYDKYIIQIVGTDGLGVEPRHQEHLQGPKGLHEPSSHLNDAQRRNRNADLMRSTGQILFAGSAILYTVRQLKFKRDRRTWDRYCGSSVGFRPMLDPTVGGQAVGMTMTIQF